MDVRRRRNRSRFGRLLAFLAAAVVVVSCEAFIAQESETYRATELPEDITELFEVHGGDPDSGTVWIYEQGGPIHELLGDYESFSAYPGHRDIYFVQPHQTLTLNADLAARAGEYTLAELQAEVDVSVEILHRTIQHFRSQGKQVVVIGHSYGAFLITRYLWQKPPENADRYLIMAGRLDMPEVVVNGFLNGQVYYFPDAVTPVDTGLEATTDRGLMEMRIAAATGHDRYTERLAERDLSRVIYVYGTEDDQVGRLTEDEVDFLKSRGAEVIAAEGGGHGSMFNDMDVVQEISDALQQRSWPEFGTSDQPAGQPARAGSSCAPCGR